MQTKCKLNSSGCGIYVNFKSSPVPISPSWTAYSYNSEFMSLSDSNAISVLGMRQKEWKIIQSQPAAWGPVPIQGFHHPRKCWLGDGQARWGTGRCGTREKPHVLRAPEAFCVTQQRVRPWGLEFTRGKHHDQTAAPLLLAAAQGDNWPRGSPAAAVPLVATAPGSHFHQIDLTCPQHKLLSSASPHGFNAICLLVFQQ